MDQEKAEVHESLRQKLAEIVEMHKEVEEKSEQLTEKAKQIDKLRFVGYVLELGYENAKIITSDPYKLAVGGIPRGSFLIMTPNISGNAPPHFTLLRVTGVSPTPLSNQVQQTYFELHKKAMPELDIWTQSELQWGALDCSVLGMFYADPNDMRKLAFSGDGTAWPTWFPQLGQPVSEMYTVFPSDAATS